MEGEALFTAPRVLLFIQGVKGGRQELHLDRQTGIALANKGKANAERLHLLTGAGDCQEVKLPLLLQKKTYYEIIKLSKSKLCLAAQDGHTKGIFRYTEQGIRRRIWCLLTILQRGIAP